ncbi:MAG: 8-amino-7-oxononanoate synthase [Aquificae bacterium]|nr:8-amino-7-oxononanoate synthase [Aquificota bacterium]
MNWLEEELKRLKGENLYRKRILREGLKDFCSNDYLGLKDHPRVVERSLKVLKEEGLGSGASQLVSGYTKHHRELEETLARFKGTPSCVLFGSGYMANVGTIPLLAGEGDLILSDELNHASLIDGCRLSKASRVVFRHRDYEQVENFLKRERHRFGRVLLVSDGVFSMDGDMADLKALSDLADRFDCILYIDDAHGTGTVGRGKGTLEELGLEWKENIVLMGTLSKALGSYGAFVCGSEELTEYLVNKARSLIFTTSLPPAVCAGAVESVRIIEENPEMVSKLRKLSERIYLQLKELPVEVKFSGTPIIPLIVGEERKAVEIAGRLREEGILLQAIRYPTVPRGTARLRMTVSLRYEEEDIELLLEKLSSLLRE